MITIIDIDSGEVSVCTDDEFFDANSDDDELCELAVGATIYVGGGAAPLTAIIRE